jgi:hypothetical protein
MKLHRNLKIPEQKNTFSAAKKGSALSFFSNLSEL